MSAARKRILFLAEGATMAHFVRPLTLADSLDTERYEVHFCAPARFSRYLAGKTFVGHELATMPGEQFLANLAKGRPIFPAPVLLDYIEQDRKLMRTLRPDLTIGDMRPSLPVSARLEKVVCAAMINAYWSPYAQRRSILPSVPITRVIPPRVLSPLYRLTEPLAYVAHVAPMNTVRKQLGLPPLPPDVRKMYTEGDYVLYPDIPEFVPTPGAPPTHHYVGICPWTPPDSLPDWWDRMVADPQPKVFVSLGSSGVLEAAPALFEALSKLPVSVVLSTSGRNLETGSLPVYRAEILPFTETAAQASVVVSHGGSGGLYPAIAAGAPVLGIPSNADMHLSTAVMVEQGVGLGVRVEEASAERLQAALRRLLYEARFRRAAQRWARVFARYDSGAMFGGFLDQVFGARAE